VGRDLAQRLPWIDPPTASTMSLIHLLFSFSGRLNRTPYWLLSFAPALIYVLGMVIPLAIVSRIMSDSPLALGWIVVALSILTMVPMVWISLAALVRRFHDRDKSGWWSLLMFVPIVGPIWIFVECGFLRGAEGENRFGPDPTKD
jgi:uncharacterized membrane protein YhaH (DUF805 family)